jgi:signal transduction histidine kinase
VVDSENIVRFANGAALSLFGKQEKEFVDVALPYAISADKVAEIAFERDGKKCTAEMRAAPFEWEGKQAYLASIRDTTEQKLLAEQLLQSQKMEAMGLLAGGVAHDFNNLLTVIVNCATFLSDAIPEGDPRRRDVAQILDASDRAEALVSQLLALTRKKSIQPRVLNLQESIQSLHALLRRTLPANIEIVAELEDAWPVLADKGQMEQVLMNLAVNAKDAMPGGGKIAIKLENADESRVRLTVRDTGSGIAPEILPRVFDPFFTTKAPGKGTGLGLATCYAIIQRAGGDIAIESKPGIGTTISILLPRTHGKAAEDSDNEEDKPEQLKGNETILVAEDDSPVLAMIAELLRKHGYTVLAASNGEDALRLVEEQDGKIDLVLSDVVMPKMSGRELAKRLEESRPGMKLLLMSAFADQDPDEAAAHEIISKPFRPKALMRKVRAALNG